jgi:hypothetical protein
VFTNPSERSSNREEPQHKIFSFTMIRAVTIVIAIFWTAVSAQNPMCYLCGGDPNATFLLPDAILSIPPALQVQNITEIPCVQLDQAARGGLLNSTQCDIAKGASEVSTTCGCSNAGAAPVVAPVAVPVTAPTSIPLSDAPSSIPSTVVSSIVPSSIPSDTVSSYVPSLAETTSPLPPSSDAPSDAPSTAPSTVVCPDGKSKKKKEKKGGMMKGGMMEGDMTMGSESGKGTMSKESKRGRRKTRAHGEPNGDGEPDDDGEYEYVCPDSIPKGKDKSPKKGTMGKGSSSAESEGNGSSSEESEGKGMMALKDKTLPEEGKKEPKRLRFQL